MQENLIQTAKSIKGKRIIGSSETYGNLDLPKESFVKGIAEKYNLGYIILQKPEFSKGNEAVILYNKTAPNIRDIIKIYIKYQKLEGQAEKLTKEENIILGNAFGLPAYEIKAFINDVFPKYTEEQKKKQVYKLIDKEAQHRNITSEEFVIKLRKDIKKVWEESGNKTYKEIWNLYPSDSLEISENQFGKIFEYLVFNK